MTTDEEERAVRILMRNGERVDYIRSILLAEETFGCDCFGPSRRPRDQLGLQCGGD